MVNFLQQKLKKKMNKFREIRVKRIKMKRIGQEKVRKTRKNTNSQESIMTFDVFSLINIQLTILIIEILINKHYQRGLS